MKNNIILIGMMGAGKSTISSVLSTHYNYKVIDVDFEIEREEELIIKDIFANYGEKHFRELELNYINRLNCENSVISTGGGVVLQSKNVKRLHGLGIIIYLNGTVDTLVSRLKDNVSNRPLLETKKLFEKINDIFTIRKDLYINSADINIIIDNKTVVEITDEIIIALNDYK